MFMNFFYTKLLCVTLFKKNNKHLSTIGCNKRVLNKHPVVPVSDKPQLRISHL